MPLVISGKLSLPVTGRPAANAEIRFRAVNSVGEIIQGAESLDRCDASGNYDISLEFARYELATKISTVDFIVHGQVTIDIDTVAVDLESLIEQIGLAGELTDELIKEFQQLKAEAVTAASEAKQSASSAAADAKIASDAEAAITPMYNYFNANYPTFETNYQDFSTKYPDVVQKHAEVVTLEGQTQAAKDLAEKWASNPENVPVTGSEYSAFHWAEKAKQNANQTFVSGGLFTPAAGNEYPDVSGISRDTIWIMEFSTHGETYTFTSGQLSGKVTGNGDMLFYDTPNNVWSLIPTAVAAGIISVDGNTGPNVNLESKYYWSGNKPAVADVTGLQSELNGKTDEHYVNNGDTETRASITNGKTWPLMVSESLQIGSSLSIPVEIGVTRLNIDGVLTYLWEPSGDFSSTPHTISNVSENAFAGYDVVTDQGTFEFQTKENLDYRLNLDSRGWGLIPSTKSEGTPTINQTSQIIKVRDYVKDNQVTVKVPAGNVLCDGDALDFKDCTVGGFLGSGVDRTQFYAATANTLTAWFDLGTTGSDTIPVTSDIQFGNFGGFSLRCNGKTIFRATSHNFFRRGENNEIRVYDAQRSFSYDYCWLDSFGPLRSQNHTARGHDFGGESLNALTFYGLEASSNVPNVRDYSFSNPNTVLLVSPDCEGLGGGMYFEDGRSVTLLNAHFESESTKLRNTQTSVNGLCVNIVGGASFNSPEFFKMPNPFQALTITNFSLYDLGADLSGVSWEINASKVIINNLNVVDSNKVKATRRQVRDWVKSSLGSYVDFCSVDGEIVRVNGKSPLYDQTDRYFTQSTTPGAPKDIETNSEMERVQFTLIASQRLSSSIVASVKIFGVVSDSGVLTQNTESEINNSTAQIVIGYNALTKRLTIDSALSVNTDISIEHNRV